MDRRAFIGAAASLAATKSALAYWTTPSVFTTQLDKIAQTTFDVVVYGGTVAGINAAYAAAVSGAASVALIEPTGQLGGMTGPGGLTCPIDLLSTGCPFLAGTFWQEYQVIAGLAGVANSPGGPSTWPMGGPASGTSSDPTFCGSFSHRPAPVFAMQGLRLFAYLNSKVSVFLNAPIATTGGTVDAAAVLDGTGKILSLATAAGICKGKVFIDASYEGDLLRSVASQGWAAYAVGRESSAAYSETDAGRSLGTATSISGVSFTSGGKPRARLQFDPGGSAGAADSHVQPMNFRVPISTIAQGGVAFTKPAGYVSTEYDLFGDIATQSSYTAITDCVGTDFMKGGVSSLLGTNDGGGGLPFIMFFNGDAYPDAAPTQRATIIANVKTWYQGLFYALANHTSFPAAVRASAATYGYDPVQFQANGNWPWQMYVREGRRMVGKKVMTQADIANSNTAAHSIGYGTYNLDIHACAAYASADGTTYTLDGTSSPFPAAGANFQIPMEALVPNTGQCPNLVVPVCMSATHIAWGAIRLEPVFGVMGDAAGCMAYRVSSGNDANVQNITYASLTPLLTTLGAKYS